MPDLKQPDPDLLAQILQKASSIGSGEVGPDRGAMTPMPLPEPEDAPLLKTLQAVGLSGMPGDYTDIGPAASHGMQAVSKIFPVSKAREQGAQMLERILQNSKFSKETEESLKLLQEHYPRVFGHVTDVSKNPNLYQPGHVVLGQYRTEAFKPGFGSIEMLDNPKLFGLYEGGRPANTAAHELTHAAQNIWGAGVPAADEQLKAVRDLIKTSPKEDSLKIIKDSDLSFMDKYRLFSEITGYEKNPYEIGARKAGDNFQKFFNQEKGTSFPEPPSPTPGPRPRPAPSPPTVSWNVYAPMTGQVLKSFPTRAEAMGYMEKHPLYGLLDVKMGK